MQQTFIEHLLSPKFTQCALQAAAYTGRNQGGKNQFNLKKAAPPRFPETLHCHSGDLGCRAIHGLLDPGRWRKHQVLPMDCTPGLLLFLFSSAYWAPRMPGTVLCAGITETSGVFSLQRVYHLVWETGNIQICWYIGADRDPHWQDGLFGVCVVRKGLSEEVSLEHLQVSHQLEKWQEG